MEQPGSAKPSKYRPRITDDLLRLKLSAMGAVLVEGAKWCGKTTTCEWQGEEGGGAI